MSAGDGFFVDSNVLLYSVDPVESAKRVRATEWLEALWVAGEGRLSWQVLHEFYWNAVRKMRLEPAKAREMVEDISQWKPVDTSLGLAQRAWYWMDAAQLPYWDALILAAAQRSGARYLLSEDFQSARRYEDIQVLNPFERSPTEFGLSGAIRPG
jgi:predicted nucleic acid-binding protein